MNHLRFLFVATVFAMVLAACGSTPVATTPESPTTAPESTTAPTIALESTTVAEPTTAPVPEATVAATEGAADATASTAVPMKVVASTSWVAALAKAAGATDITVIAPSNIQHPPDYDPKPSDLVAVNDADIVLMAGFEGFAARMQEAVGADSSKLVTVMTENSPEAIRTEVTRLGELFGTQDTAQAFLTTFDATYEQLSSEVKASIQTRPVVVAQAFAVPWVVFAGLEPSGTYGPMPLTPGDLQKLVDLKPTVVFENVHMGGGQPVVEATGATKIDLLNFPGDDLDLMKVFATNAERIKAALGSATTATTATTTSAAVYPVTIENCGRSLTFEKAPERVISLWQPPTEMLLALGLEDRIIALAGNYAPMRPDLQARAEGIKVIGTSMGWPSKEVLLSEQPDLVISEGLEGFMYDSAQGYATAADIEATGAKVVSTGDTCTPLDAATRTRTITTVYDNLTMLGKIFGVADRADALVAELKQREAAVVEQVAGRTPVKVAFYNGGTGPVNVQSNGIWADLMEKAGGTNVVQTTGYQVSVEEFAASQPDVILMGTYPGQEAETMIAFLKETFPTVPAVQNNRLVPVPIIETEASVRVIDGLEQIARGLHPEAFSADATTTATAQP